MGWHRLQLTISHISLLNWQVLGGVFLCQQQQDIEYSYHCQIHSIIKHNVCLQLVSSLRSTMRHDGSTVETPHPNHIVFNENMFENTMAYTNSFSKLDSLTINRSHLRWTALSIVWRLRHFKVLTLSFQQFPISMKQCAHILDVFQQASRENLIQFQM